MLVTTTSPRDSARAERPECGAAAVPRAGGVVLLLLLATGMAHGGSQPQIDDLRPRGLQLGSTTSLTLRGSGLTESLQLLLPNDLPVQYSVRSLADGQCELQVALSADAAPGLYPLRIATVDGVSNAVVVGVDALPQLPFQDNVVSLPVALHGTLQGDQILRTKFVGTRGQRLVVDVESRRLGGKLRPVVRVISPANRLLGTAQPTQRLAGDARLIVELPEDGEYLIELSDSVYRGEAPGWFRLKLGDLQFADLVFPLAVTADRPHTVELVAGDQVSPARVRPQFAAESSGQRVAPEPAAQEIFTGAAPWVRWSPLASERTEASLAAEPRDLAVPVAVNGRIGAKGEVDSYRLTVTPGDKLQLQVEAARWDSALDAVLDVVDAAGNTLATADDQPGSTDPALEVEVPPGVEQITIRVRSLVGDFGPAAVYRVRIEPRGPRPFRLTASTDRVAIPAGGRQVLPLAIDRGEVTGPIALRLSSALEPMLRLAPAQIDAADEVPLVALSAAPHVRGTFPTRLLAESLAVEQASPVSLVTEGPFGSEYRTPWREALWLSVTEPGPLGVDWATDGMSASVARGARQRLTVQVRRAAPGPVRLSLLTSQRPPTKTVDNRQVEDLDKTLRLDPPSTVIRDQDQAELTLVVPLELPLQAWSLAVRAELLSADEQTVLATTDTEVVRRPTIEPLGLKVELPNPITVQGGNEQGLVLRGRLERHPDYPLPTTIKLSGLTEQDPQPNVTLAADQSEFELVLKFPAAAQPREIGNVQLIAVGEGTGTNGRVLRAEVRSAPFTISITP